MICHPLAVQEKLDVWHLPLWCQSHTACCINWLAQTQHLTLKPKTVQRFSVCWWTCWYLPYSPWSRIQAQVWQKNETVIRGSSLARRNLPGLCTCHHRLNPKPFHSKALYGYEIAEKTFYTIKKKLFVLENSSLKCLCVGFKCILQKTVIRLVLFSV